MFFTSILPLPLSKIIEDMGWDKLELENDVEISGVAPIDQAQSGEIAFLDNPKYRDHLPQFKGSAIILNGKNAESLPENIPAIIVKEPYPAWAKLLSYLYPDHEKVNRPSTKNTPREDCLIEENITISQGVVLGKNIQIGAGSYIGPNVIISDGVCIGRGCYIGANTTIIASLIGDRVTIHNNCGIGQDGFGFAMGAKHIKVPQIGRVIIQDDVDIGAGTMIDRGALGDTVIGQGTKIDNLVQIGHNVEIGMHCVIAGLCGISGSTKIGNYCAFGGQVGLAGHLNIGDQVKIAAKAGVMHDIPSGEVWSGIPALPIQKHFKQIAVLRKHANNKK